MSARPLHHRLAQRLGRYSLRTLLILPFGLVLLTAVVVIGWFSLRANTHAVETMTSQLRQELTHRITQELDTFLAQPMLVNQLNADAELTASPLTPTFLRLTLQQTFWKQLQRFPYVSQIGYISRQRPAVSVTRNQDGTFETGVVTENAPYELRVFAMTENGLPSYFKTGVPNIDTQNLPSFVYAFEVREPAWTPVNVFVPDRQLFISAVHPLLDERNRFVGTYISEVRLWQIDDFLQELEISPRGQAFIMERNGLLVATSNPDVETVVGANQLIRVNALDHENTAVRLPARFLATTFNGLENITTASQFEVPLGGEDVYLQVTPYVDDRGIEWLIVLTMPTADFLAPIEQQRQQTTVFIAVALLLTLVIGWFTAEWIIRPIQQLNDSARTLADGRWGQPVQLDRYDELGQLALSFNRMAAQLQEAFTMLEQRVAERTAALQEAKEEAEQASLAKSQFLAHMSHELRTPLNAILGFTQLMREDENLSPTQTDNLRIIYRSGEHLLSLINDILTMSKIEAGHNSRLDDAFDLTLLLREIHEMFLPLTLRNSIFLDTDFDPDLPRFVVTDERKLRQILTNLLSNALKFTAEGGITLEARPVPTPDDQKGHESERDNDKEIAWLYFAVRDSGSGISADELETLFEPFTQASNGQNASGGTGLGLPISREFVQLLGGDLDVDSVPGEGSCFAFTIPVALAHPTAVPETHSDQAILHLAPDQPNYRILLVEDKPENRLLLRQILERVGYTVAEAYDGREAVLLNARWRPDLIWMDMRLPVLNGYEATRKIRQTGPSPQPIIVALTASAFEEDREKVLGAGCDGFLQKPIEARELLQQTARFLGAKYIYGVQDGPAMLRNMADLNVTQLAQTLDLRSLPAPWLTAVQEAAERARHDELDAQFTAIEASYPAVATSLRRLLDDFRFDLIQQLCTDALANQPPTQNL